MEISRDIKLGIADYLRRVTAHLHDVSAEELIEIQQHLEAHIYEALRERAPEGPTIDDLRAVLAEMPSPESYDEGTMELPAYLPAREERTDEQTLVRYPAHADQPTVRVSILHATEQIEETAEIPPAPSQPATPTNSEQPVTFWSWLQEARWELPMAVVLFVLSFRWLAKGVLALWL